MGRWGRLMTAVAVILLLAASALLFLLVMIQEAQEIQRALG